ncbi:MAG: PDZ domain-containing protein [Candidatus Melainabacteria bacterium]|nr:PDZ domain-containing protein [Candidatus Melainabacteria bacterium]
MFRTQNQINRTLAILALCLVGSSALPGETKPAAPPKPAKARAPVQQPITDFSAYGYPYTFKIRILTFSGTFLSYVKPGTMADKCGLRAGDIVYTVNHRATPNPAALKMVLQDNKNTPKRIEYFRSNGKKYEVKVTETNEMRQFVDRRTGKPVHRATQAEMEDYLITLVNADRAQNGLSRSLRKSSGLSRMARSYADDMAKRNFHGHKDPEGRDPWARAKLAGLTTINIRENCAYPFPEPDSLAMVKTGEAQLMDSPEHKVSIVQADNVCVGVGCAYRNDGGLMIVQVFSPDDVP